jgi:hypothetical protein
MEDVQPQAAEAVEATEVQEQETPETQEQQATEPDWASLKRKIKVNGEEREVAVEDVFKDYQKYSGADAKFREAAQIRQKYQGFEDVDPEWLDVAKALREGNLDILSKKLPKDKIREFSEKQLLDFIEWNELSDAEKENLELKQRLEATEAEKKQQQEAEAKAKQAELDQKVAQNLDVEFKDAFSTLGMKPTPSLMIRAVQHMAAHLDQTKQPLPAGEGLKRAMTDWQKDDSQWLNQLAKEDPGKLKEMLPDVYDAFRKYSIKEVRAQDPLARSRQSEKSEPQSKGKPEGLTIDDYFNQQDQRYGS